MYSASEDTLRFCDSCQKWFHLDCLTTIIDHADVDWFDPAQVHKPALWLPPLDIELVNRDDATLWMALLRTPIQRRYTHLSTSTPVSFEIVLLAARRHHLERIHDAELQVLPDVRRFISKNILGSSYSGEAGLVETFTAQLLDIVLDGQKEWWGCKICNRFI